MADTECARYTFSVKEGVPGSIPFIALEPLHETLEILRAREGHLHLDLREGTTVEQAEEIAAFLNAHIVSVGCLTFR